MSNIHFECPKCQQTLDAPKELASQLIECPTCKETIEVPVRSKPPILVQPSATERKVRKSVKGSILDFSIQANAGFISGDDNQRYQFTGSEWRASEPPTRGMRVDFEPRDLVATGIFREASHFSSGSPTSHSGNKFAAGICAILLGSLGVHKFILGITTPGIIMLLVSVLTFGVGAVPMAVIGIIEGITYLTKTDDEFYRIYVVGKKAWF
jgi:TM2 domain-containing membrane protein YozV